MASKKQQLIDIKDGWAASEISITYRTGIVNKEYISNVEDAYKLISSLWNKELINIQEQLIAFYFNSNYRLIGYRTIGTGDLYCCPVNIKLLVSLALHTMAYTVVIAHNHPSGDLTPSPADLTLTARLRHALRLIDVKLLDHFIISENSYFSFKHEKKL